MYPSDMCLRAVTTESRDGWMEAQLLDLDLAIRARTMDGVLAEIEHAIVVLYLAAKKLGTTPFATTPQAPKQFREAWKQAIGGAGSQVGVINLPAEVGEALATALRVSKPAQQVRVLQRMA